MEQIHDWADIAEKYTDSLLLGNGASIAIDPCFPYHSLKEVADDERLITESVNEVFQQLNTQDFELVLNVIQHAQNVNKALQIREDATSKAYEEVKNALVEAVRLRHTSFEKARSKLTSIADFMKPFKTVFSLNYDLIVYWAMMEGNKKFGTWFKDCFVNDSFERNWEHMRGARGAQGATLVFYPHGNLVLLATPDGSVSKIKRQDSSDLLRCVLDEWRNSGNIPVFVSEGATRQKERAIQRSSYLATVYQEVMASVGQTCATYGWSASNNDDHILTRLCVPSTKHLAFSIYLGDRTNLDVERECVRIRGKVANLNGSTLVEFYSAHSPGCWITPKNKT